MNSWLMWDSTTPGAIPFGAAVVAPYRNGLYAWPDTQLHRFSTAAKAFIDVIGNDPAGCAIADVETGDLTPAGARHWLGGKPRGSGCVYCNRSTLPAVLQACHGLSYFVGVATLDGTVCLTAAELGLPAGVSLAFVQAWDSKHLGFNADLSVIMSADWLTRIGGHP